jgi:hypothetical protein
MKPCSKIANKRLFLNMMLKPPQWPGPSELVDDPPRDTLVVVADDAEHLIDPSKFPGIIDQRQVQWGAEGAATRDPEIEAIHRHDVVLASREHALRVKARSNLPNGKSRKQRKAHITCIS